jgi:hypothetical protein
MGLRHSALYEAIKKGRGPRLTPVRPAPFTYPAPGSKRSHYVRIPDAIAWLEARDPERWADAIRTLKVERIVSYIRAGVALPRPASTPYVGTFRRSRGNEGPVADVPIFSVPGY